MNVLAWFCAVIERDGLPEDGETEQARSAVDAVLTSASDLLDVLDRYPENPVPMNRDSATVRQLRAALAGAK